MRSTPATHENYLSGEDALQRDMCKLMDIIKLPYYSIPNGGYRLSATSARRMKMTGLKAGVPDIHIPVATEVYHSLYIEVKLPYNKPTKIQKQWHETLRKLGHRVEVVKSMEELFALLSKCYPSYMRKVKFGKI